MKNLILFPFLFSAAITYGQDKDQIESTVTGLDQLCKNIDSNSQELIRHVYDYELTKLYIDQKTALCKASISGEEFGHYTSQELYLEPECKNITFVHESSGAPTNDADFKGNNYEERETWYYIQDKKIIKKIDNSRSYNMDNEPPEWKTEVSYPLSNKEYVLFENSLSYIIEDALIKKDYHRCDD